MLRTILLFSPVFVSLFWAITLMGNQKLQSAPRTFLSWFMILPLICFFTHFLYFAPLHSIYIYFDYPYQFAGSLVLPFYYIYFRLLTVDERFSFKAHARYLVIPAGLATIYCVAASFTPRLEYRTWLFDEKAFPDSPYIQFLTIMRYILRIQYLILVVLTVTGNFLLIRKYGNKAEQFYSDINDGKFNNAKRLNYSIIIICVASFLAVAVGRGLLMPKDTIIYSVWSISTVMLYIIGYMGYKQKPINPTFEPKLIEVSQKESDMSLTGAQKKILQNLLVLFEEKKVYLDNQLNIMDIVQAVGTNRTYISSIINHQYNQNFCTFVNNYRLEELKHTLQDNPDYTNDMLAESCGFGSVISLKRAVTSKHGLTMGDWKKQILN